jgi:hypothetical protein
MLVDPPPTIFEPSKNPKRGGTKENFCTSLDHSTVNKYGHHYYYFKISTLISSRSLVTFLFEKLYIFSHLIILYVLAMSSIRKILMKYYSVNKGFKFLIIDKSCIIAGHHIAIENQSWSALLDNILIIIRSSIAFYIFLLTIRVCDNVCNCASFTKET